MKRIELPHTLNEDKTSAAIALPETYVADVDDLEGLIAFLAGVRATMKPDLPALPPASANDAHEIGDAEFLVRADPYGVMISVAHPGIGWFMCRLRRGHAANLHHALGVAISQAPDVSRH